MPAAPSRYHILTERSTDLARGPDSEIRAFARCRNEHLRLPAFLAHYRKLGVDRFFIVDDRSDDGSTEYLADQPDVHLYRPSNRYDEASSGIEWLNALLGQFGTGRWCVTVDIDELLAYPGSEHSSLRTLTQYFDSNGYQAMACMLLDLYPAGPIAEVRYDAGGDLLAAAPFFDRGPYERIPVDLCPGVLIRGGARERVFYPEFRARGRAARLYEGLRGRAARRLPLLHDLRWLRPHGGRTPPVLTKAPLVRWADRCRYKSAHWLSARLVAPETGTLLHFKLLGDFHARAVEEAARGQYYDSASEYRRYAATLARHPDATFRNEQSVRYEGTSQLVRLGLMHDTREWANARGDGVR